MLYLLHTREVRFCMKYLLNSQHQSSPLGPVFARLMTGVLWLRKFQCLYELSWQPVLLFVDSNPVVSLGHRLIVPCVYDKIVLSYDLWSLRSQSNVKLLVTFFFRLSLKTNWRSTCKPMNSARDCWPKRRCVCRFIWEMVLEGRQPDL